ncbi:ABC transporter ATP-binding protein [Chelativorans salis]|uniref:ATP-binding cassette domain-containing protein n=1 Tax=Chelativorans salis TaxID=2978478 RepID=A0ABT2LRM4_9HYPH|nr:oligopeptide/dipeptide ABC transporter ATP-binding protein [Chelativorans sp. EGI FJ00035]MCT7376739.1 ATP-binding cassette domain-containing protein [Chelativorans sp. EGI FJ00035]
MNALVEVDNLNLHFPIDDGFFKEKLTLRALTDVSFSVEEDETLAIVGESGSGKTTLGYTISGLLTPTSGRIKFGAALGGHSQKRPVQLVFQDPFSALDPRMMVGDIVAEPLRLQGVSRAERLQQADDVLEQVGLPAESARRYPHEFSGGQRQRIAIARALIAKPKLIVADEPLSALDVSIQSQILNLLNKIKRDRTISYLFISHDLGVVHHLADRVIVLYLGRIMEIASRQDLFATPSHPYTQALLESVPRIGRGRRKPGQALKGEIPTPLSPPPGCVFHTRCPRAQEVCRRQIPELLPAPGRPEQLSACHFKD